MEIKFLSEEWFEKNKFDCNVSSVRDAMLSMDSKLKEVEACCIKAGLGSIGYQDKTDLIEEWYDIQNRLVKAVDGIGSYIIDEIDKPFAENIAYIYDKAKAMSLDNYTTKNIFHNSKTSGVEGLSTFHEKEKITLHDLMGMAQLETVQTDDNFLDKATGIYHQQYNSYKENNKNISFDDFIAQTFGIQNDKMTNVNKNELLGMIGGFVNHWEPHNLIQALSEIYEEEKEKNGSFLTATILRAANTRKVPTSGKITTTTVRVTLPKLKGSQMAECAVYVLRQRNSINEIFSKAAKKAMEALLKARKNLEGTEIIVTGEQLTAIGFENVNDAMVSDLNRVLKKYDITDTESIRIFLAEALAETSGHDLVQDGNDKYLGGGYIQLTFDYGYQAFATYKILEAYPDLKEVANFINPGSNNTGFKDAYDKLLEAANAKGYDIKEFTDIVDIGKTYVASNFAWESSGYFWSVVKNLNPVAEKGSSALLEVSKKINGYNKQTGLPNGWTARQDAYKSVCEEIK